MRSNRFAPHSDLFYESLKRVTRRLKVLATTSNRYSA